MILLIPIAVNTDWEEISQDDTYIYVGDFGNNANGNRTDLNILRISKSSLTTSLVIDTINFSYSLQSDFTATGSKNTDFDCEAFIVDADSIYLFTKEWVSKQTSVYAIPKTLGTFIANYKSAFDVQGMITGATYMETEKLVALCGYNATMQPFIYLLFDFNNDDFFSGNKRKLSLDIPLHQVEGIATEDGLTFYVTNEGLVQGPINNS